MIRRDAARARRSIPMVVVLQVNAVVALVVGVVLLAATWSSLFEHLSKFRPVPWIYAQMAGAAFVGLAWMLWTAAKQPAVRTTVAQGAAIVNLVSFVCISVWVFSNDRGIPSSGSLGSWAFDVTAVLLATLGVLEARVWWRRPV